VWSPTDENSEGQKENGGNWRRARIGFIPLRNQLSSDPPQGFAGTLSKAELSHEVLVDRECGFAAFENRPHNQRLAAPHISGGKKTPGTDDM